VMVVIVVVVDLVVLVVVEFVVVVLVVAVCSGNKIKMKKYKLRFFGLKNKDFK